jgi:hypothetical protein
MRKDRYNGYNDKAQQPSAHTFRGSRCDDCGLIVHKSSIPVTEVMKQIPCADNPYNKYDEDEIISAILEYLENSDHNIVIGYNRKKYATDL